jgi:hypothetical protein
MGRGAGKGKYRCWSGGWAQATEAAGELAWEGRQAGVAT